MQVLEYFEPILDVFMVISSRISVMKLPLISWLSPPHLDHDFINSIPRVIQGLQGQMQQKEPMSRAH